MDPRLENQISKGRHILVENMGWDFGDDDGDSTVVTALLVLADKLYREQERLRVAVNQIADPSKLGTTDTAIGLLRDYRLIRSIVEGT